ncbi:MAG: type II secretion system protein GspG [Planctomycetes bacterium]|nr:type II secretion system protein GspG [Planctomycetota bacterium]
MAIPSRNSRRMTVAAFLFLVAVAILLPLLCGLVGWRYWRVRKEAPHFAKAHHQLDELRVALMQYDNDFGRYPPDLGLLETLGPQNIPYTGPENLKDPWGHPFVYSLPESGPPHVRCLGHDGVEGGTGIDADLDDR